jgi:spermidine dehydrogenase
MRSRKAIFSAVSEKLIRDLGIDVEALSQKIEHRQFYDKLGLRGAVFFDRETFGVDKLVVGRATDARTVADFPLPDRAKEDIRRIESGSIDFMPGLSSAEEKLRLSKMSYRDFLRDVVRAEPATVLYYQARTHGTTVQRAPSPSCPSPWP